MSGTVPPLAPAPVLAVGYLKPALARCFCMAYALARDFNVSLLCKLSYEVGQRNITCIESLSAAVLGMKRFIKLLASKITFGKHPKRMTFLSKANNKQSIAFCFHTVCHRNLSTSVRGFRKQQYLQ